MNLLVFAISTLLVVVHVTQTSMQESLLFGHLEKAHALIWWRFRADAWGHFSTPPLPRTSSLLPPSPPSLSLSIYLSGIHGLLTSVTILTVYSCTFPLLLSLSLSLLHLFLSLCLFSISLSLSLSLFLYHRLCKVQLWLGESDPQTRWQEDAFSEYALLGSLCVTLFSFCLFPTMSCDLVLNAADWLNISDIVSWVLKRTSVLSLLSLVSHNSLV